MEVRNLEESDVCPSLQKGKGAILAREAQGSLMTSQSALSWGPVNQAQSLLCSSVFQPPFYLLLLTSLSLSFPVCGKHAITCPTGLCGGGKCPPDFIALGVLSRSLMWWAWRWIGEGEDEYSSWSCSPEILVFDSSSLRQPSAPRQRV